MLTPYRISLFNSVANQAPFELKVLTLTEREQNRQWQVMGSPVQFEYEVLDGWHLMFRPDRAKSFAFHVNLGVSKRLLELRPDIIITSGYSTPAYWEGFLYSRLTDAKYILWNGTTLYSSGRVSGVLGLLKKVIIRSADGWIAYGSKAKEYLEFLGADPSGIVVSINTVDMEYFHQSVTLYRAPSGFNLVRSKYPGFLFIYVGRLVAGKGLLHLLRSVKALNDNGVGLLVVGDGPERAKLEEFCKHNSVENTYFVGFQRTEKLSQYYALADALILPSLIEPWGLVVNEALASGLYVACSKYAGAGYDLIKSKRNGELFDPLSADEFVSVLQSIVLDRSIKGRRRAIAQRAVADFSIEKSTKSFTRAIKSVF